MLIIAAVALGLAIAALGYGLGRETRGQEAIGQVREAYARGSDEGFREASERQLQPATASMVQVTAVRVIAVRRPPVHQPPRPAQVNHPDPVVIRSGEGWVWEGLWMPPAHLMRQVDPADWVPQLLRDAWALPLSRLAGARL